MNMAEYVKPGPDLLDGIRQLFATEMGGGGRRFVQHTIRRCMCYQDISIRRNHLPIPPDRSTTRDIEGPVVELRLNGRSPDIQARKFRAGSFEIDGVGQQLFGCTWMRSNIRSWFPAMTTLFRWGSVPSH
jgi:hypothetical protein